jgi:hypothetical protein
MTTANAATKSQQIRLTRRSPAYWRVAIDNPPINVMGPEMVRQWQETINVLEADEHVRVVVFDSAVNDYFLNHADFNSKLEDLTALPAGPSASALLPTSRHLGSLGSHFYGTGVSRQLDCRTDQVRDRSLFALQLLSPVLAATY